MGGRNGINGREVQFNAEISRRVERLRVRQKVQHRELAKAASVSQQMLRAYQIGVSRWPVFRVGLIADFFGVPVRDLMPRVKSYVKDACIQEELFLG